jgi:hypothetical protein
MGIGLRESLVVAAIVLFIFWWRIRRGWPNDVGGGPTFGFGTVPIDDPPPPRDPNQKSDCP